MLGKLVHSKNVMPFFPQHSFKDGKQYNFKKRDSIVRDIWKSHVKVNGNKESKCDMTDESILDEISNVESKTKLLRENSEYFCDENCNFASANEMHNLKSCLERCSKTNYKSFRELIEKFDFFANEPNQNVLYRLSKSHETIPTSAIFIMQIVKVNMCLFGNLEYTVLTSESFVKNLI